MKNTLAVFLILWFTNGSCQTPHLKQYHVEINPIGNRDVPLDTFYITCNQFYRPPSSHVFTQLILTNEATMSYLVQFIKKYNSTDDDKLKNFNEYGCNNILLFNNKVLARKYKLNRSESVSYFKSLIGMLKKNKLDEKLIKKLNEALEKITF